MDRAPASFIDRFSWRSPYALASFLLAMTSSRLVIMLTCSSLKLDGPNQSWLTIDPLLLYLPSIALAIPLSLLCMRKDRLRLRVQSPGLSLKTPGKTPGKTAGQTVEMTAGMAAEVTAAEATSSTLDWIDSPLSMPAILSGLSLAFATSSACLVFQIQPLWTLVVCLTLTCVTSDALRAYFLVHALSDQKEVLIRAKSVTRLKTESGAQTVRQSESGALLHTARIALLDLLGAVLAITAVAPWREQLSMTATLRVCSLVTMLCALFPVVVKRRKSGEEILAALAASANANLHWQNDAVPEKLAISESQAHPGSGCDAKALAEDLPLDSLTFATESSDTRLPQAIGDIVGAAFCGAVPLFLFALTIGGMNINFSSVYWQWICCVVGLAIGFLAVWFWPINFRPTLPVAFCLGFIGGAGCLLKSNGLTLSVGLIFVGLAASVAFLACTRSIARSYHVHLAPAVLWQLVALGIAACAISPCLTIKTATISSVLFFRSLAIVQIAATTMGLLFYLTKSVRNRSKGQIAWRL